MNLSNIDPYDLTVTRGIRVDGIRTDVTKESIVDQNTDYIYQIETGSRGVGQFEHPLLFKTPSVEGYRAAIDARLFTSTSPLVKEQLDILRMRAALTLRLANSADQSHLFDPGLMIAFANLVGGMMAKQFNLDPLSKMNVLVVSAAYWFFITRPNDNEYSDEDHSGLIRNIVRHMRLPAQAVESALNLVTPGRTLQALVDSIKTVEGTDRTSMLTPATLINCCSPLWFGINKDHIMGIFLEHPPTFAAVVYAATGQGAYSRAELGKRLKADSLLRPRVPHTHSLIDRLAADYLGKEAAW